jgi:DNA-binding SARP family transcriptional activator/predicted ATPase
MLEVRLLGQFKVEIDGVTVEIASRPAQSLFAYLMLNPETEHRREKLAGLFWPESSESNARNNLRQALWRIRKALEEGDTEGAFIVGDSFVLSFNPQAPYWLDTAALEEELPEARPTEELIEQVSLYEGELLPGFYDDWVVLERERLQASFERKMQHLMESLVQEKRWHEVLEWGERWIALGQVPELAFRALMIAHGGLGDTSSVASTFQRCVDTLSKELGVEPSEDTKVVHAKLSKGEKFFRLYPFDESQPPQVQDVDDEIPEPIMPAFLEGESIPMRGKAEAFVAREEEFIRLERFLEDALGGHGKVVFITGDAGSGKTALIQEFAHRAQTTNPDLLVTFGDCNALSGIGDPYLPFREALGVLCGNVEAAYASGLLTREQVQRLWANLPLTIQSMAKDGPDLLNSFTSGSDLLAQGKAYNPHSLGWLRPFEELVERKPIRLAESGPEQADFFNQYTRVLQGIASRRPLLLLLDDLQWADLGSLSLLFHLGRRVDESRILILGAYRPMELSATSDGESHPLLKVAAEFKRNFGDIQIDLEAIDHEQGRRFVDEFLDTEPNRLGENFREALYHRTGGHPLFTIELLRAMEVRGDIVRNQEGQWGEGPSLDWDRLPAKVEGVVEERVNKLDDSLQKLLTVASVEGAEFTAEVLAGVLGLDRKIVVNDLSQELDKRHRLVLAQGVRRLGEERVSIYRFRHTLFETHLYNQLDPVERTNLHEEVGSLLEDLYGEAAEEVSFALARHFDEAGIPDKAVAYYEKAGNRAKQLSANEDAISHLTRAIELVQTSPDSPERAQRELGLQISLGAPLITARGYGASEVNATFTRARELSIMVLDPPQLFPLIYGLRSFYLMRADHETARGIAEQLIAIAEQEGDSSFFLQAHEALGSTLFYLGKFTQAKEHLERGIELYDAKQHQAHAYLYGQDPGVACKSYLGLSLWNLGYPDRALSRIEDAIDLGREQEHPFSLALALDFAASLHVLRREGKAAKGFADEAIEISEQHNFPMWLAMGKILAGWAQADQVDLSSGIEMMQEGLDAWQRTGATLGQPNFFALLADALGRADRVEEAQQVVAQALQAVQNTEERVNEAELFRLHGELLQKQGSTAVEVEKALQRALHIAGQQKAKSVELQVGICLGKQWVEQGKPEKARALLDDLCGWFSEGLESLDMTAARGIMEGIA